VVKKAALGLRWDVARIEAPIRPHADRQAGARQLAEYIWTVCPDDREVPGFDGVVAKWDRNKHGGWTVGSPRIDGTAAPL
jgi:hypothetical protein